LATDDRIDRPTLGRRFGRVIAVPWSPARIGLAALVALLTTTAFLAVLSRSLVAWMSISNAPDGSPAGDPSILFEVAGFMRSLPYVAAVALLDVPIALGVCGLGGQGAGRTIRDAYSAAVGPALAAWTIIMLLWIGPIVLLPQLDSLLYLSWPCLPVITLVAPMTAILRGATSVRTGRAVIAACLGSASFAALPVVSAAVWTVLFSPMLLLLVAFFGWSIVRSWMARHAERERFRRSMLTATSNPADASAHLNLGLLLAAQGHAEEAVLHLRRALEIDPTEIDAHYELGKIARAQGRLADAIGHFGEVVAIDDRHSSFEVWREIGETYYAAGQLDDAYEALSRFVERRETDARGRYALGLTLAALGRHEDAGRQMEAVVEIVRTAPSFKYRLERRWMTDAEVYLQRGARD
jgi:tetratricopeptide (TPR) repeat protein